MVRFATTVFTAGVLVLSAGGFARSQCHDSPAQSSQQKQGGSIVEVASKAGSFGTLLAAATQAGFADDLANAGPYTVLAPTDAAFAKLGEKTIKDLLKPENRDKLRNILRYHVIAGEVSAVDALRAGAAKTRLGQEVRFAVRDGKVLVNDSTITTTDVKASNGVIHVIDTVLIPDASEQAGL